MFMLFISFMIILFYSTHSHKNALTMTSNTGHLDRLLKEYLIFRGFIQSAKNFEAELNSDKDKGFRADALVDVLLSYIINYDWRNLVDFWKYLDNRLFCRLRGFYHPNTKKLYFSLLKYFVVNASANNKSEKIMEFYQAMSADLIHQTEWKEWHAFPFIKNPDTHELYSSFFSKTWQDALQLSLFNYLSVTLQSMPLPALLQINQPSASDATSSAANSIRGISQNKKGLRASMDLMDDFYNITQKMQIEDSVKQSSKAKGLIGKVKERQNPLSGVGKSKLKTTTLLVQSQTGITVTSPDNKLLKTLPIMRQKPASNTDTTEMREELLSYRRNASVQEGSYHGGSNSPQEMQTITSSKWRTSTDSLGSLHRASPTTPAKTDMLYLGQQCYKDHGSSSRITHLRFSLSGHLVASADSSGVVKIWTSGAVPTTQNTIICKTEVLCLEWIDKQDSMLLIGFSPNVVKLYEVQSKKTICDMSINSVNSRLKVLAGNSTGKFMAAANLVNGAGASSCSQLSLCSPSTKTVEKTVDVDAVIGSAQFVTNDTVIIGQTDGSLTLIDLRQSTKVKSWKAHSGSVNTIHVSRNICTTIDSDHVISQWAMPSGKLIQSSCLHDGAAGPFSADSTGDTIPCKDKLFAFNGSNQYFLTCHNMGATVYKFEAGEAKADLSIGGHNSAVLALDWVPVGDMENCVTGDSNGLINLTTLLSEN